MLSSLTYALIRFCHEIRISPLKTSAISKYQFQKLIKAFDFVVGQEQDPQRVHAAKSIKLLDLVVTEPQLLQRASHVFQLLYFLDVIATE